MLFSFSLYFRRLLSIIVIELDETIDCTKFFLSFGFGHLNVLLLLFTYYYSSLNVVYVISLLVCMVLIGLVNNYYLKWIVYNLCSVYYVNKNLHRIFLLFCSLHSYTTQTHIYNIPLILQYSIVFHWWINCLIELIWSELMLSSSSSSSFALKIMQIFICEKDIGKICS